MLDKRKTKKKRKWLSGLRAQRIVWSVIHFAIAAVLSSVTVLNGGSTLGVAYAAACCRSGNGFVAVLGTFAGYIFSRGGAEGVGYAGAALIVLAANTVFSGTGMATATWFSPLCTACASAMTGFLFVTGDAFSGESLTHYFCDLMLGAGGAYFYEAVLNEERLRPPTVRFGGILVLISTLLMAAYPFAVADLISPARIGALLGVMGIAYMGGFAYGAASGAGIGTAMDAAGGAGLYYSGIYALCALVSGFFSRSGRVGFATVFVLAHAAVGFVSGGLGDAYLAGLYECFVASVVFVLIPDYAWRRLRHDFLPEDPEPTDYAARVCRLAGRYASAASEAFSEMYQSMASGAGKRKEENDLGAVFDRTADRVCRRCSAREACWERDKLSTLRTLETISGPLLHNGHVTPSDFPGHFAAQCLRFPDFMLAINEGMDALYQRRQSKRKSEVGRKLIAQQYAGVTGILKQVGGMMSTGPEALPTKERELRTYAEAFGKVRSAAAWRDRAGRLHFEVSGDCMSRILKNKEGFLSGLSALMNLRLAGPESVTGPGGASLLFRQLEPYQLTVGIGTRTREGQEVSGDCVKWFITEEGTACAVLSDGMGSGRSAAEDSKATVRMAEQFLRTGIDAADTVRTIGPALKLRTQGNAFVTLDIGTIDLFSGDAQSVKCGAAPSFVRSVDGDGSVRIRRILSQTLPAGLEESGEMDVTRFHMGSGDALVLLTDGIADSSGQDAAWLEQLLENSMHLSAKELAARIVLEASARGAADDMTAAVLYLTKRRRVV